MSKTKINLSKYWSHRPSTEHNQKGQIRRMKLLAKLSQKGRILDIGYYNKPNPFLKGEVYGIDVASGHKFFNYKKTFTADLDDDDLPFKKDFFDTVIIAETLEHIQNTKHLLKEIRRVMKPTGILIVTVPNMYNPNHVAMEAMGKIKTEGAENTVGLGHVHNFLPSDFMTLIRKNKFKLVKMYGTYYQIPFTNIQWWIKSKLFSAQHIYVLKKLRSK